MIEMIKAYHRSDQHIWISAPIHIHYIMYNNLLERCSARKSGRHTNPQLWDRPDSCPMIGQVPRWNLCQHVCINNLLERCSARKSGRHTNPQLWDRSDSCPMIGQVPRWNLCHVLYGATIIRDEFRTILTLTYD